MQAVDLMRSEPEAIERAPAAMAVTLAEYAGDPQQIASVVLLRSDHNTHSLTTGDRYVKLAFRQKDDEDDDVEEDGRRSRENGELRVRAPKLPAQAIPGIYLLFVVDRAGVPSVARRLDLKL